MADSVSLTSQLSLLDKAELCVIGGGLAGVAAALTASDAGLDTILIEERGALGWEVSHGLELFLERGAEIPRALERMLERLSALNATRDGIFDPVALECLLDKMMQEAKVRVHFRAFAGAIDAAKGFARLTTKSGPLAVQARVFIDATETSRLVGGASNTSTATSTERACLLCAVETPTALTTVNVDGVAKAEVRPTLWPHEAHVRVSVNTSSALAAESTVRFALARTIEALRKVPGFEKASLALSAHESFVLNPEKLDLSKLAENVFVAGPRVLGKKPSLQERVALGAQAATRAIAELRVNA